MSVLVNFLGVELMSLNWLASRQACEELANAADRFGLASEEHIRAGPGRSSSLQLGTAFIGKVVRNLKLTELRRNLL